MRLEDRISANEPLWSSGLEVITPISGRLDPFLPVLPLPFLPPLFGVRFRTPKFPNWPSVPAAYLLVLLTRVRLSWLPGAAEGVLFEDDNEGYDYRSGGYLLTTYEAVSSSGQVTVRVHDTEGSRPRPRRMLAVRLLLEDGVEVAGDGWDGEPVVVALPRPDQLQAMVAAERNQRKTGAPEAARNLASSSNCTAASACNMRGSPKQTGLGMSVLGR